MAVFEKIVDMNWYIAASLFFLITNQCSFGGCVPVSEVQRRCIKSVETAQHLANKFYDGEYLTYKIYDGEPEKCFLYFPDVYWNDGRSQTLKYAIDSCNDWGTEFLFSCTLTTPKDKAKIQEYLHNEIYRDYYNLWVGCSKTDTSSEPAGWVWQTPFPLGSTVPATTIPWQPKNGSIPQQPDNNGGNANQCVYAGGVGIQDENADDFMPMISEILCECVDRPRNSSCSIQGVDQYARPRSNFHYFKAHHDVQNCALKCEQETDFICKAFVWKGPKSDCYLYGQVDTPVVKQSGSEWILIDLDCVTSASCQWPDSPKKINPVTVESRMIEKKAKSRDHCLTLCLLGKRQPPCRAYAFSANPAHRQKNCYLFPALKPEKITAAAAGDFTLSQNSCH
uniref:Apple domain-containing protein n=1 Tax=Plectus sambesii TaxID=2011161 RepID=A0A914WRP1_9BILA